MPVYSYHCGKCDLDFDQLLPMSQYKDPQPCEECGEEAQRVIKPVNFNLPGDDWASKNGRLQQQMKAKNDRLVIKQNEKKRDGPGVRLVPNVGGERVESWGDAKKLAESQGKSGGTYEQHIKKEQASKK